MSERDPAGGDKPGGRHGGAMDNGVPQWLKDRLDRIEKNQADLDTKVDAFLEAAGGADGMKRMRITLEGLERFIEQRKGVERALLVIGPFLALVWTALQIWNAVRVEKVIQ